MSLLAGLALLAALVAAGWWPMLRLAPAPLAAGRFGRLSLACALGAAITGLVQVALSACGVPAGPLPPAGLAVASLLLSALRARRARDDVTRRVASSSATATARGPASASTAAAAVMAMPSWLATLLVVVAGVSLAVAVGTPFRSDGGKFWAPKARELAAYGASNAPSLHDPARLGLHRDYPLLVPALLAPVFALSPAGASSGPKLLLGSLNVALLGVLAALLLGTGSRPRAIALLAVFATQPLLVALDARESAAAAGFVDSADALFLLLFVAGVDRLRASAPDGAGGTRGRDATFVCIAGAALVSTKLEGAIEAGCVLTAWVIAGQRRAGLVPVSLGLLMLALPTFVIRSSVAPDASGFELSRLVDPATVVARGVPVLAGLAGLLVDVSSFGLLPLLLVTLGVERGVSTRGLDLPRERQGFGLVLCIGAASLLVLSYLATDMAATRHIDTSAHRLLWHWLPAATWLAARGVRG